MTPVPLPIPGLAAAAAASAHRALFTDIVSPRRGRAPVAQARQMAIYLEHVALGANLSACARLFARDRATTRHACARIEDMRDDTRFDCGATRLERALATQRDMVLACVRNDGSIA